MKNQLLKALKFLLLMTVLTGIIYPLLITGIAQIVFPQNANGNLMSMNGKVIGSALIGQKFDSSIYFWSRPSACDYNPVPSGASNYGPTSDTLKKLVNSRRLSFASANHISDLSAVPKEYLFASGSGLDPHISPEAALVQIDRISQARHFNTDQKSKIFKIVDDLTEPRQLSLLGEKRVNVLKLNLALDNIK